MPFQREKAKDSKGLIFKVTGSGIRLWEEEIRFEVWSVKDS